VSGRRRTSETARPLRPAGRVFALRCLCRIKGGGGGFGKGFWGGGGGGGGFENDCLVEVWNGDFGLSFVKLPSVPLPEFP